MNKSHGIFITIEGIEGVGKSSAITFLKDYFQDHDQAFVLTREPGGTEIAEVIRKIFLSHYDELMAIDTELLLMFAGRAQHINSVIQPALAAGKIVISDRFTDATYAYQGGGRGIDKAHIAILEKFVQKNLQPDLTILLDAPIEVSLQRIHSRGAKDRIEEEHVEFFQRVRDAYLARAREFPNRFIVIDATQTIDEVQLELKNCIEKFIPDRIS